ncbi:DUF1653 domain-containing protein [archaeon]|jgi:hypothetical protein|nr:DUF1653 domain-containing protein [archaeon]MBT6762698.1 DUF1653 domain-containing protein [archaeon]
MTEFNPSFYQHFRGNFYLAYGVGQYCSSSEDDVFFAKALHHESLNQVKIYSNKEKTGFKIEGIDRPGLDFVLYQELYGDGKFWVREVDSFMGEKVLDSGESVQRFKYLGLEIPTVLRM